MQLNTHTHQEQLSTEETQGSYMASPLQEGIFPFKGVFHLNACLVQVWLKEKWQSRDREPWGYLYHSKNLENRLSRYTWSLFSSLEWYALPFWFVAVQNIILVCVIVTRKLMQPLALSYISFFNEQAATFWGTFKCTFDFHLHSSCSHMSMQISLIGLHRKFNYQNIIALNSFSSSLIIFILLFFLFKMKKIVLFLECQLFLKSSQ